MGTIIDQINLTFDTKSKIREALEKKGVKVNEKDTFASYADKINQISEWQPEQDWWDIDKILADDTEDYPAKMIVLLTSGLDEMAFQMTANNKIVKIRTSDGKEYTQEEMATVTHNWDISQDKASSRGYSTRYYIAYFSDTEATISWKNLPIPCDNQNRFSNLYIILQNLTMHPTTSSHSSWFNKNPLLEYVKCINSKVILDTDYSCSANPSLKRIENALVKNMVFTFEGNYDLTNIEKMEFETEGNTMTSMFSGVYFLTEAPDINTENVVSFQDLFNGARKLRRIKRLNFNSATNTTRMFSACTSLVEIEEISNIKISGIDLSTSLFLNRDTLLRILDALYDYSEAVEQTYNLKLGTVNLAKLSEPEIAVATEKGWTLA